MSEEIVAPRDTAEDVEEVDPVNVSVISFELDLKPMILALTGQVAAGDTKVRGIKPGYFRNPVSDDDIVDENGHLRPSSGAATAGGAPIIIPSGPLNTVPEEGAIERLDAASSPTFVRSGTRETFAFLSDITPALNNIDSVFGRTGAVVATLNDYSASLVGVTPAGAIESTNVQDALVEIDAELTSLAGVVAGITQGPQVDLVMSPAAPQTGGVWVTETVRSNGGFSAGDYAGGPGMSLAGYYGVGIWQLEAPNNKTFGVGFATGVPVWKRDDVQSAAIADATDAASVITSHNLLLAAARTLGLIAP